MAIIPQIRHIYFPVSYHDRSIILPDALVSNYMAETTPERLLKIMSSWFAVVMHLGHCQSTSNVLQMPVVVEPLQSYLHHQSPAGTCVMPKHGRWNHLPYVHWLFEHSTISTTMSEFLNYNGQ